VVERILVGWVREKCVDNKLAISELMCNLVWSE
jgi:hypothetical protein